MPSDVLRNTVTGPDDINNLLLHNLPVTSLSALLKFFNRKWKEHAFPVSWKQAFIIPILKASKDATNPSSYRSIELTSCQSKRLEKVLNERLVYFYEHKSFLSSNQSGFHRHCYAIDNAVLFETDIPNAFVIFFGMIKA